MVTLRIDDETFAVWEKQAEQRGLTVEEWLRDRVSPAEAVDTVSSHVDTTRDDWQVQLQAFISLHEPTGHAMDDSRESIYD